MSKYGLLLSGGLDSTYLLYKHHLDISHCFFINYGATHNAKEYISAKKHCDVFGKELIVLDLTSLFITGKSSLLGGSYPSPIVTFRNPIFLMSVIPRCISLGLDRLMLGVQGGDYVVFKDCRKPMIDSFNTLLKNSLDTEFIVEAPLLDVSKESIRTNATVFGITNTWSCYEGGETPCGKCLACTSI